MLDNTSFEMQQLLRQNTLDPDHSCFQVFHFLSSACLKSVFSSNQTFNVSNIFIFFDGHCHGYQKVSQTSILLEIDCHMSPYHPCTEVKGSLVKASLWLIQKCCFKCPDVYASTAFDRWLWVQGFVSYSGILPVTVCQ